jgi:hypothetical protein
MKLLKTMYNEYACMHAQCVLVAQLAIQTRIKRRPMSDKWESLKRADSHLQLICAEVQLKRVVGTDPNEINLVHQGLDSSRIWTKQ